MGRARAARQHRAPAERRVPGPVRHGRAATAREAQEPRRLEARISPRTVRRPRPEGRCAHRRGVWGRGGAAGLAQGPKVPRTPGPASGSPAPAQVERRPLRDRRQARGREREEGRLAGSPRVLERIGLAERHAHALASRGGGRLRLLHPAAGQAGRDHGVLVPGAARVRGAGHGEPPRGRRRPGPLAHGHAA